jgi:NADPH-dependent ferric siderophore reductase
VSRVILIADETALPAMARWIEMLPERVDILGIVELGNESDAAYLEPAHVNRARVVWLDQGTGALERCVRGVGELDDDTYVWAAGEATSLIPIRRYLRRESALPAHRLKVDGYWKRGEAGRDHHAPIDPADPQD